MMTKKISIDNKFSEPQKSKTAKVVKVPGLNNLNKNRGCRDAGNAILESLEEIYTNEQGKIIDRSLLDIEEIQLDNNNLEEQELLIYKNSLEIYDRHDKVIFLGGDHSISFSIGRAFLDFCKEQGKEASLIVFDAHADCCRAGKEPTHEEWLRALIESGFPSKNILLVGVRNIEREEIIFIEKNKIRRINMNELNNIEEISDIIMDFCFGKELYVSFDIDVIDPAFAPSTAYREPGGLTSRQALYIISRMSKMKNLKIFDIVEVDCENDKTGLTVKLVSKLLAELL